jgi:hypothetical protein
VLTIRHDGRQIPIASDARPFHTSRGFLRWRFAYAGPTVRAAPPSWGRHPQTFTAAVNKWPFAPRPKADQYVRNCSNAFGAGLWRRDRHILFKGQCHCGAIRVELTTDRQPGDQVLGACQCSFCRKHNARAFSDPKALVTLTAADPQHLQRYSFGLKTSDQIICRRCGVYVAMTLTVGGRVCGASSTSMRSMTVHCSLARPRRATTAPRIARDASPGERLAGARRRSLAGRRLLLGRTIRSAAGHKRRF